MPYIWTAIHLADVLNCSGGGSDSLDRSITSSGSNSLGKLKLIYNLITYNTMVIYLIFCNKIVNMLLFYNFIRW